jgi:hypothetical protein
MSKFFIIFVIILMPFSLAIKIDDIELPEKIYSNEDFFIKLNITDVNGNFDIKLQIKGENSTINKVWNNEWQRSDWYINKLIDRNEEYNIKILINDYIGEALLTIRIRETDSSSYEIEKIIPIEIILRNDNIEDEEKNEEKEKTKKDDKENYIDENINNKNEKENISDKTIIKLNYDNILGETVYEDKTEKIKKILFYLLAIFFVLFLLFQLLRYGKRNNDYRNAWETEGTSYE